MCLELGALLPSSMDWDGCLGSGTVSYPVEQSFFSLKKRKVSCGKENQNGTAVCRTEAWVGISLWRNIYALYFFRLLGLTS
jgi:hypothetical protein